MKTVWILARKEVSDGLRNRWILGNILLLGFLALSLALLGSTPGGSTKSTALGLIIVNLASLSVYLLPLLGLLLSFDALVGERESGTLALLLSYRVRAWQIVLGKLFGHSVILALALLIGYGGAGVLLAVSHGAAPTEVWAYLRLLASSLLLGMVFLGLGYLLSASVRERATAVAGALGIWFVLVVLYDMILLGVLIIGQGRNLSEQSLNYLLLVNPTDAYRMFNLATAESAGALTGLVATFSESGQPVLLLLGFWLVSTVASTILLMWRREV